MFLFVNGSISNIHHLSTDEFTLLLHVLYGLYTKRNQALVGSPIPYPPSRVSFGIRNKTHRVRLRCSIIFTYILHAHMEISYLRSVWICSIGNTCPSVCMECMIRVYPLFCTYDMLFVHVCYSCFNTRTE